ncbi:hypothetical protein D3C85_1074490 [compost metagenome]
MSSHSRIRGLALCSTLRACTSERFRPAARSLDSMGRCSRTISAVQPKDSITWISTPPVRPTNARQGELRLNLLMMENARFARGLKTTRPGLISTWKRSVWRGKHWSSMCWLENSTRDSSGLLRERPL